MARQLRFGMSREDQVKAKADGDSRFDGVRIGSGYVLADGTGAVTTIADDSDKVSSPNPFTDDVMTQDEYDDLQGWRHLNALKNMGKSDDEIRKILADQPRFAGFADRIGTNWAQPTPTSFPFWRANQGGGGTGGGAVGTGGGTATQSPTGGTGGGQQASSSLDLSGGYRGQKANSNLDLDMGSPHKGSPQLGMLGMLQNNQRPPALGMIPEQPSPEPTRSPIPTRLASRAATPYWKPDSGGWNPWGSTFGRIPG